MGKRRGGIGGGEGGRTVEVKPSLTSFSWKHLHLLSTRFLSLPVTLMRLLIYPPPSELRELFASFSSDFSVVALIVNITLPLWTL